MRTCSWPPMNFYITNNLEKAHLMIPILLFKKVPVFMHMYMYACVCMHWRTTQTLVIRLNNKTLLTLHISSVSSTLPGTKAYTPYTVFWKMYFYFLCVCLHVCMCTTYITGFWEGQRGCQVPWNQLPSLSYHVVLEAEPGSSARRSSALDQWSLQSF